MASAERPHFIPVRRGDWLIGAGDEPRDAVHRRCLSSGGGGGFLFVGFFCAGASGSTYFETRSCASPRVDYLLFLNQSVCRGPSAGHRRLLRHQSLFRPDSARVFRRRVLDWLCATPHRGGSLDSMDSTANDGPSSWPERQPLTTT